MNRPTDLKIGTLYRILWFDNTENILQYAQQDIFTYPRSPDKIFELFWIVASKGGLKVDTMTLRPIQPTYPGTRRLQPSTSWMDNICPVWDRVLACTILEVKYLPLFLDWDRGPRFEQILKGTP
jgi:hypothetical protein